MPVLAGPCSMHVPWLSPAHLILDVQKLQATPHSCAPAERPACCPWVAELSREEESKMGRDSPVLQGEPSSLVASAGLLRGTKIS